jgi:nickel transport system substrate-binding protein
MHNLLIRPVRIALSFLACVSALVMAPSHAQAQRPVVIATYVASLDPHVIVDYQTTFIQINVYDNLYRYGGDSLTPKPWLATSHKTSADGKVWEFTLREGGQVP